MVDIMSKNAYLKAMEIDIWVERNPRDTNTNNSVENNSNTLNQEPYNTESLNVHANEVIVAPKTESAIPIAEEISPVDEVVNIDSLDWQALQAHVSKCQLCELSQTRSQTIFGTGNQSASLMIIGDDSNQQSGKLLTSMLKAMGLQRSDVYITHIVKCNLVENQDASQEQAELCESYLLRQISLIQPKLILTLGNSAAQRVLKSKSTMNRLRGQLHYIDGINAPILVSYHPTYLMAAPNEKRKAWEDLQLAMKELSL